MKKYIAPILCSVVILMVTAYLVYAQSSSPPQPGWFPTVSASGITVWTRDGGSLTNLQVSAGSGAAGITNNNTFTGTNVFSNPIVGDGSSMTNLTYRYTTNALTARAAIWGAAVFTNIAANFTVSIPAPNSAFFETAVMWLTNSSKSDFTVTFPNGVWGTPGSGAPPVYYCTNKMLTRIMVEHYGQLATNAYKLDFAP